MLPTPPDIRSDDGGVCLADFYAVPTSDKGFVYAPSMDPIAKDKIDGLLPKIPTGRIDAQGKPATIAPSRWLLRHRRVMQLTWDPKHPIVVEDQLYTNGGVKVHPGAHVLNLYEPPAIALGDAALAAPWVDHIRLLYPNEADLLLDDFAHRRQHPGDKVNHADVLGGSPGIGKDFILQGLKYAVGHANFHEIGPDDLKDLKYTPWVKSVALRLNEAHDLGDSGRFDRFALHDRLKVFCAAPPDMLACADKYIRRFYVPNVLLLLATTNHLTDGLYLPPDDRRHLVCWTLQVKEDFTKEFWDERWAWLHNGGANHIAAYLQQRDLRNYHPCAPPRQTAAFWEIVTASAAPEDDDLIDAIAELSTGTPPERPEVITISMIRGTTKGAGLDWLVSKPRVIPHRLSLRGYSICRNSDADDGRWELNVTDANGKPVRSRQKLYVRSDRSPDARRAAARQFADRTPANGKSRPS